MHGAGQEQRLCVSSVKFSYGEEEFEVSPDGNKAGSHTCFYCEKRFSLVYLLTGEGIAHWEKAAQRGNARCLFEILHKEKTQAMSDTDRIAYNRQVVEAFRANGGKVQGWGPLILLTTRGAKSGQLRIYPLMSVPDGDNYIAVASKGGAPENPLWYHNLLAHPDVTVEVGNETFAATARLLTGHEREQTFAKAVAVFPPYGEYQKKTARQIPVFLLERRANA
jgi:F420H(2)-dependent quinone reductase